MLFFLDGSNFSEITSKLSESWVWLVERGQTRARKHQRGRNDIRFNHDGKVKGIRTLALTW